MSPEEFKELEKIIDEESDSKQKIDAMNSLAFEIRNLDTPRSVALSKESQQLSQQLNYTKGLATSLNNEAFCYVQITDYRLALEKSLEALRIFEEENNELGIAQVHYNLCIIYIRLSDYNTALDSINKSIVYYQKENIETEMARCYNQMGHLYRSLNDPDSAIEYQTYSLDMSRKLNNGAGEAASLMALGLVYLKINEVEKSRDSLLQSMVIQERIKDRRGYAASLNAYMTLCLTAGKFEEAEQISKRGIELASELGDRMGISRFMVDLARIYFKQNKITLAEQKALEALSTANDINLPMAIVPSHLLLSEIYELKGDYKKALQHHQLYFKLNEEAANTNAAMKAKSLQFVSKIETAQKEAEINRLKNVELKNAFEEIEEKNREITDSITYALRIQTAILPSLNTVKQHLKKSFILYKPKDIVAGDFYWMEAVGDLILFAACDCTGHGVPGAMVSVVCNSALERAVREFGLRQPAAILDKTAQLVVENFSKSEEEIKDGMDISLCALNLKTNTLQWAGANNPLWLLKNKELIETKADKQAIGMNENTKAFTNHTFNLRSGDSIYIFTDGFADQFGGETGNKKLTRKRFKELILSNQDQNMHEQAKFFEDFICDYRKGVEQIDDILVMGVRI